MPNWALHQESNQFSMGLGWGELHVNFLVKDSINFVVAAPTVH